MDDGVADNPAEPRPEHPRTESSPASEQGAEPEVVPRGPAVRLDISSDVRAAAENRYERRAAPVKEATLSLADEMQLEGALKVLLAPHKPQGAQQKTQLLLLSLGVFLIAGLIGHSTKSFIELGMLVGVIFFHELGHMAGMIAFGYRDVRIFFIPFLGGAASGKKRGVARWKEAVVLLLGPLPGIIAGVILIKVVGAPSGLLHTLALQLLVLNALNLLPIHPLDGGQFFSVLLFSRNRHLEVIFTGVTCALLGIGALLGGMWVIAIVVYFVIRGLPQKKRILDAGYRLRRIDPTMPSDPMQLTETQQRRLWREMWDSLPEASRARYKGQAWAQASTMEQVLERATMRPPSVEATVVLLVVWFAGLVGAAYGAVPPTKPAQWAVYHNASPAFSIEMAGTPTRRDETGLGHTTVRAGTCEVTYGHIAGDEPTWLAHYPSTTRRHTFAKEGIGFIVTGEKRCLDSFKLD